MNDLYEEELGRVIGQRNELLATLKFLVSDIEEELALIRTLIQKYEGDL